MVRGMIRLLSGLENVAHYVDDALIQKNSLEDHLPVITLSELCRRVAEAKLTVRALSILCQWDKQD